MKRIVVGVGIAGYPVAAIGISWAFFNWALAFRAAGWEVWLAEEIKSKDCIDFDYKSCPVEKSANLRHWHDFLGPFGWLEQSTLLIDGQAENRDALLKFAKSADLFLNISGHFKDKEILSAVKKRIYLDLDPAFTQIWAEVYHANMNLEGHDFFVSVGSRMNARDCAAPTLGRDWISTFPPVSLEHWSSEESAPEKAAWTTITHWHGYAAVEYKNESYGNKSDEFEKLLKLPGLTMEKLEVATDLTSDSPEFQRFTQAGWRMTEAKPLNETSKRYKNYLVQSRGEFSPAKNGYVKSRCGWFSDRSVCYLALGRPVILQETGWSQTLPAGEGLLTFNNTEEAAQALKKVASEYPRHAAAARRLAETYFSGVVVVRLLESNLGSVVSAL